MERETNDKMPAASCSMEKHLAFGNVYNLHCHAVLAWAWQECYTQTTPEGLHGAIDDKR